MGRKSKWSDDGLRARPVSLAARKALQARLRKVVRRLPLAAKHDRQDPEHVHQLRVACRRASAALELYAECLPRKELRKWEKQLRRIRRAAGPARDLDVLSARLTTEVDDLSREALACIESYRKQAQRPLRKVHRKLKRSRPKKGIRRLAQRTRWRGVPPEPTLEALAPRLLRPTVQRFFALAQDDLYDIRNLHRLRIQAKRVRYALELLVEGFDPSLRTDLYPIFQAVQDRLGRITDHHTASQTLASWAGRLRPRQGRRLRQMAAAQRELAQVASDEFRQWWSADCAGCLQQQFESLLRQGDSDPTERAKCG